MVMMNLPQIHDPTAASVRAVTRFVWYPVEVPPPPRPAPNKLHGIKIALVGGTSDTSDRVTRALKDYGATVHRYRHDQKNPDQAIAAFKSQAATIDGIIDLNVEQPQPSNATAWEEPLKRSVSLIKAFYNDWAREADSRRLFYMPITVMDGQMGYGEGTIHQPLGGIWAGLAKSLPREIPNCNVRILDVSPEDHKNLEHLIVRELYAWGLFEIGYYQGKRYTLSALKKEVSPPSLALRAADTILISGGGRGIGFALAKSLARDFGCRVIVTGRSSLPSAREPWLAMDQAEFKRYQQSSLKRIPQGKKFVDVRRRIEQIERLRELQLNLDAVQAEGLDIEYHRCDFTSRDQVRRLINGIGSDLIGIVHNAGVDTPIRLNFKSVDSFLETLRPKIDGLLNILHSIRGRTLRFLCNVGSLTGRWGGMTGETDYAAANEGLSRLGMWATQQLPFPVKTICWPTWENLGMIKNFGTTLKYMSALDVDEGVSHWTRELLAPGSGEVMFMGHVGKALSPIQLSGFPPLPDIPNIDCLSSDYHYLGELLEFRPFRAMRTRTTIDPRTASFMHELKLGDTYAIPISILLEYAVAAGGWVPPEGWPDIHLQALEGIVIHLDALKNDSPPYTFDKQVSGKWLNKEWVVDVTLTKVTVRGRQPLAQLRLVYGDEPLENTTVRSPGRRLVEARLAPTAAFSWEGLLFKPAKWKRDQQRHLIGEVRPCHPSDLWCLPHPPQCCLPVNHLENLIQASMSMSNQEGQLARLHIAQLKLLARSRIAKFIWGSPTARTWHVVDEMGQVQVSIDGAMYEVAPSPLKQAARTSYIPSPAVVNRSAPLSTVD